MCIYGVHPSLNKFNSSDFPSLKATEKDQSVLLDSLLCHHKFVTLFYLKGSVSVVGMASKIARSVLGTTPDLLPT
jgi:hypothetical protein